MAPVIALYKKPKPVLSGVVSGRPNSPVAVKASALRLGLSVAFVALAIVIISLPRNAYDVSAKVESVSLPLSLNGTLQVPQPLLPVERAYFEQFGGSAQKALYGALALTIVQTSSPLRHLHSPDDCLRGLGYDVEFVGTRFEPVPTAIYKATDPEGQAWRVSCHVHCINRVFYFQCRRSNLALAKEPRCWLAKCSTHHALDARRQTTRSVRAGRYGCSGNPQSIQQVLRRLS